MGAASFTLLQRLAQHLHRQAMHLHIHLQGGNTLAGTRYLKVHVARKVLGVGNVAQYVGRVTIHHQAHSNTANRGFDGHASIHQGQAAATGGRHAGRAVLAHNFCHAADGIGELFFARQYCRQGALRQVAVANLTPARATQALDLTHRVAGGVVVVHVAALAFCHLHSINELRVAERC